MITLILIGCPAFDLVGNGSVEPAAVVLHLNSVLNFRTGNVSIVLNLLQLRNRKGNPHLINIGVGDRARDRRILLNRQANAKLLQDLIAELQTYLILGSKARRNLDILEVKVRAGWRTVARVWAQDWRIVKVNVLENRKSSSACSLI